MDNGMSVGELLVHAEGDVDGEPLPDQLVTVAAVAQVGDDELGGEVAHHFGGIMSRHAT